jgi:hypothetical protein
MMDAQTLHSHSLPFGDGVSSHRSACRHRMMRNVASRLKTAGNTLASSSGRFATGCASLEHDRRRSSRQHRLHSTTCQAGTEKQTVAVTGAAEPQLLHFTA